MWPDKKPDEIVSDVRPETLESVKETVECFGYWLSEDPCECPVAMECWQESFVMMKRLARALETEPVAEAGEDKGMPEILQTLKEEMEPTGVPPNTGTPLQVPVDVLCHLCTGRIRTGEKTYWTIGFGCRHVQCGR